MNVKYELIQQNQDESIDLQVAKDMLLEAVIENPKTNIHTLFILHNSFREYSPLASLIAEQFLNKNICAKSSIKTASAHELYQPIKNGKVEKLDNPLIVVITAHKVQNLSNMGLKLLTLYTPVFKHMQIQVYEDVYYYAQFVKDQLSFSSSLMLVSAHALRRLNIQTKLLTCGGQELQVIRYYKKFYSIS